MKTEPSGSSHEGRCICGEDTARDELRAYDTVRPDVSAMIAKDHPEWGEGRSICRDHLTFYRRRQIEELLEDEFGELGRLEQEVLESLESGQILSQSPDEVIDQAASLGDRMADRVASFGGSWTFILSFCAVLILWMALNVGGWLFRPFDPYPFILLNLVLSSLAALQAPVIMMSQRRQELKDRLRAENDYRVNLKAELEIRQLHEKIDHQLVRQWEHLRALRSIESERPNPSGPQDGGLAHRD